MQKMIICIHCKREVPANPRLKGNQRYCSLPDCQNARQKEWYQNKIKSDPDYAARQNECKESWRKNKPAHAYQTRYREDHPEYVKENRERQRERNRKRLVLEKRNESKKIVKIDTLPEEQRESTRYNMKILTPNVSEKIVKIDAFIVELQKCQDVGLPSSENCS